MKRSIIAGAALLLMSAALAQGQSPSQGPSKTQQQAHAARQAEIRRQNYAQQEAIRLLFGPQGIPALTRPSDPWNYQRPRVYLNQPGSNRYGSRYFYR